MRKKIAAANWKMNLTWKDGANLINSLLQTHASLGAHQQVIIAVPAPYLTLATELVGDRTDFAIAAQNCHHKPAGAFTGEVAASMLQSVGIRYCIIGHSERREYQQETNTQLAEKLKLCFENGITPIFCCGEALSIREKGLQNEYVKTQLAESLFTLEPVQIAQTIIAYEPIWAIGTGQTASTAQAEEMHQFIRAQLIAAYGNDVANCVSILYGGSVNEQNASELFASPSIDGGLVGGASLQAAKFSPIINALA